MPSLVSRQIYDAGRAADASEGHSHTLVHPETGLANDYLNIFNELVMLVEQLPSMPEFLDDVLAWTPISYIEYFQRSSLPGSQRALERYRGLDPTFRARFESAVAEIDKTADTTLAALRKHLHRCGEGDPRGLAALCRTASASLRDLLNKAATLVNDGEQDIYEAAQNRADRLLAARTHGFTDF
jgi:hypothetical protein